MTSLETKLSKAVTPWMPFIHATAAGFTSTVGVGVFAAFLYFTELAGRTDFRWLLLAVMVCLLIAAFTSPARTVWTAIVCGILFAGPVIMTCALIALDAHGSSGQHPAELRFVMLVTAIASPGIMVFLARLQRASSRSGLQHDPSVQPKSKPDICE